jgi:peptide/nickel transport system substrate-binding protein
MSTPGSLTPQPTRWTRRQAIGRLAGYGAFAAISSGLLAACQSSQPVAPPATAAPPPATAAAPPAKPAEAAKPVESKPAESKPAAPAAATAPAAASSAAPKGELTITHPQKVTSLDSVASAETTTGLLAGYIMDPLIDFDAKGELVPKLALTWRNVDPTTWELKLRPNVKFHDGTAFDSKSVKYSLELFKDEKFKTSPNAPLWAPLDKVETPDATTALIKTTAPVGPLLQNLTRAFMLPPDAYANASFAEKPIGTGPFKLAEWAKGERVVLEASTSYWQFGLPKANKITWREVPEVSTRVSALERGELDLVLGIPAEEFPRLKGVSSLNIDSGPIPRWRQLWMNAGVAPTDKVQVRQAIQQAADLDALVNDIMSGFAKRQNGLVSPDVFGYVEQPPFKRDVARAKALLTEAGLPNGIDLEMKWSDNDPKQKEIAEILIAQLGEANIRVKSNQQDRAVWTKDLLAMDWQLNLFGNSNTTGDADFTLRRLYVSSFKRTGYVNQQLDQWLNDAGTTTDQNKRKDLYKQAADLLWKEGPCLILFQHVETYGWNKRLSGFAPAPDGRPRLAEVGVS